ncbi:hypothetical protein GQ55_4G226900 [Panicum hallii var. hallii]|uniref:Uncharacterized protein n=1 Tax=Panicum hallii var. hallii TaxID=1504633 RepID=A0A2T7DZG6_9POAL|nr:hypothetical protein GQ55_4G226900 [Panicum hallii var. hallii]
MAADPGGKPWPMMKPRPGLRTRGMPSPPIRLSILTPCHQSPLGTPQIVLQMRSRSSLISVLESVPLG